MHPTSAFVIKTHTQTVGGGDSSKAKLFINIVKSTHVAEATAKAAVGGQQCSLPIRDRIPSENGRRRCRTTTSVIIVVCALVHALSLGKGACCLCFVVAAADFFFGSRVWLRYRDL